MRTLSLRLAWRGSGLAMTLISRQMSCRWIIRTRRNARPLRLFLQSMAMPRRESRYLLDALTRLLPRLDIATAISPRKLQSHLGTALVYSEGLLLLKVSGLRQHLVRYSRLCTPTPRSFSKEVQILARSLAGTRRRRNSRPSSRRGCKPNQPAASMYLGRRELAKARWSRKFAMNSTRPTQSRLCTTAV
jgi:hypothetical protein